MEAGCGWLDAWYGAGVTVALGVFLAGVPALLLCRHHSCALGTLNINMQL